jgi:hypothetical protein
MLCTVELDLRVITVQLIMHPLLEYLAVDYLAVWSICNPKIFLENLGYLTKQWDLNLIIILTLIKEGETVLI